MTTPTLRIAPPAADEYGPYYGRYIEAARAAASDVADLLERQLDEIAEVFAEFGEARAEHRYAPAKWSVKEVAGHLADGERIFAYRALRAARGDRTPLASFDENAYVAMGGFARRPLAGLVADLLAARRSTLGLVAGLDEAALERRGVASGMEFSVRAVVYILAGHVAHHLSILRERYR